MSFGGRARKLIKRLLLGNNVLPERFFLGLSDPQTEVAAWLHGMGEPLDVTQHHSMACAVPLTICLAFDKTTPLGDKDLNRLSLKFCERGRSQRVLGEIGLKYAGAIAHPQLQIYLFKAKKASNQCLSQGRLWMHYLILRYSQRHNSKAADINLSFMEKRAMDVLFICPRPVVLVSACDASGRNMFPMNVMGDLDNGYFAFALKESKWPAQLVERTGRLVLSSVPQAKASFAYQIAANHNRQSIDWYQLPFPTMASTAFKIPIPAFAHRAREMEVEAIQHLGSHTFFLARIVRDEVYAKGVEMCVVHGFYQAWRMKKRGIDLNSSLAEHSLVKTPAQQSS